MEIKLIGDPKIIMSNPNSNHNYFGWPTAIRLKNGKIAVACSGFRLRHICPFGKAVISFSEDEGETYTPPAPVIDTPLDDRDGGLTVFGDSGLIYSSFNNTRNFQRSQPQATAYDKAYLDTVTDAQEKEYLGVTYRISYDNGITYGPIYKSPVTSPHGPIELSDGTILWVGRTFSAEDKQLHGDVVAAYTMDLKGGTEYIGQIDNITDLDSDIAPLSCEPHTIELDDGRLLTHIRVQTSDGKHFTIYQSESSDKGKTWTKPVRLLPLLGGSPPHILKHSSGALVCTYGYRQPPFGVKTMISFDNGATWDSGHDLYVNGVSGDLGYPSSVELADGSLITIFYARPEKGAPAVIMQQKWSFEK